MLIIVIIHYVIIHLCPEKKTVAVTYYCKTKHYNSYLRFNSQMTGSLASSPQLLPGAGLHLSWLKGTGWSHSCTYTRVQSLQHAGTVLELKWAALSQHSIHLQKTVRRQVGLFNFRKPVCSHFFSKADFNSDLKQIIPNVLVSQNNYIQGMLWLITVTVACALNQTVTPSNGWCHNW